MNGVERSFLTGCLVAGSLSLSACAHAGRPHRVAACDGQPAADVADSETVTLRMVQDLFSAGAHACSRDGVFLESYNVAVYNALERAPLEFVQELARIPNQAFVLEQLQRPLRPELNPERALYVLAMSGVPSRGASGRIVRALRTAHQKRLAAR